MNTKQLLAITTGLALATSVVLPAFAQTPQIGRTGAEVRQKLQGMGMMDEKGVMKLGIPGTVTAINGTSITMTGQQGHGSTTAATLFTVDATNAVVRKGMATSTLSGIAVGDKIYAQGTVNGTTIKATTIEDGLMGRNAMIGENGLMGKNGQRGQGSRASSTPVFTGNGEPVVMGAISAINGNSVTVTNPSGVTYTVDVTNAKIIKGPTAVTVTTLVVGDKVLVQGTVNGTAVSATTVIDQSIPAVIQNQNPAPAPKGFFGGVGSFFKHMFGF